MTIKKLSWAEQPDHGEEFSAVNDRVQLEAMIGFRFLTIVEIKGKVYPQPLLELLPLWLFRVLNSLESLEMRVKLSILDLRNEIDGWQIQWTQVAGEVNANSQVSLQLVPQLSPLSFANCANFWQVLLRCLLRECSETLFEFSDEHSELIREHFLHIVLVYPSPWPNLVMIFPRL